MPPTSQQRLIVGLNIAFYCAVLLLFIAGCVQRSDARPITASAPSGAISEDWPQVGGEAAELHHSALTSIDSSNVARLGLAWSYAFDTNRGQESIPVVVDGTMYVTSAWSKVFALDAATGGELWRYDPNVPGKSGFNACCDVVNRGVAVSLGRVLVGTLDGRLVALNAATGKELWSVQTLDGGQPYSITGAPRIFKDTVVIGNAGGEYGVRGYITAYDLSTGRQKWRFFTVPAKPGSKDGAASDAALAKIALQTWSGHWFDFGGGGTVWDSIVYDEKYNQIYIGVGNGTPWDRRVRSNCHGDNLFLASIVALDADTGTYRWHYQESPGESWDFDASQGMVLTDLLLSGEMTPVLMQASKNGFFYVIERRTGKLLSAQNYVPENWADGINISSGRPNVNPDIFYAQPHVMEPSAIGAHSWQSMAFSPENGLAYIPATQMPLRYGQDVHFKYRPGAWNTAIDVSAYVPPADAAARKAFSSMLKGDLIAWDPVKQEKKWSVPHDGFWNGGVLSTSGNLVFQGEGSGIFNAYQADSGTKLWAFHGPTGIIAAPISYSVGGIQYVAVVAGWGGILLNYPQGLTQRVAPPGRVMVFRLDGKDMISVTAPVALPKANPSTDRFSPHQLADGQTLYGLNCAFCHGQAGIGGDVLPDLRRAAALNVDELWQAIVMKGVLESGGMVGFKRFLSPEEAESIRAYLSKQAEGLRDVESGTP